MSATLKFFYEIQYFFFKYSLTNINKKHNNEQ